MAIDAIEVLTNLGVPLWLAQKVVKSVEEKKAEK